MMCDLERNFQRGPVGRPAIWRRSLRGWVANLCEYEDFRYFIHKVFNPGREAHHCFSAPRLQAAPCFPHQATRQ